MFGCASKPLAASSFPKLPGGGMGGMDF